MELKFYSSSAASTTKRILKLRHKNLLSEPRKIQREGPQEGIEQRWGILSILNIKESIGEQ